MSFVLFIRFLFACIYNVFPQCVLEPLAKFREKPDKCLGRDIYAKFKAHEKKTEREKPDGCLERGIHAKFRAHKNERGMSDGYLGRDSRAKFRTKQKGLLLILFASLFIALVLLFSEFRIS